MARRRGGAAPPVTEKMAAEIKYLRSLGFFQHDIAARFGVNQGRVSEVLTGKRFPNVPPGSTPPTDPQPRLPF